MFEIAKPDADRVTDCRIDSRWISPNYRKRDGNISKERANSLTRQVELKKEIIGFLSIKTKNVKCLHANNKNDHFAITR
jgi:hypothetical protein